MLKENIITKETTNNLCPECSASKETSLKNELHRCRETNKKKERKIQKYERKINILTIITVAIGAILGKEFLDGFVEWLDTIGSVKSNMSDIFSVHPEPSTMAIFVLAYICTNTVKRRK